MRNTRWIISVLAISCLTVSAAAQQTYRTQNEGYGLRENQTYSQRNNGISQHEYGVHAGNMMLSLEGGVYIPVSEDMRDAFKTGFTYGLQALVSATDNFAIGLEFMGTQLDGKNLLYGADKDRFELTQYNVMLATRMYANPANRVRFYTTLGVGAAFAKLKEKWKLFGISGTEKDSETGFAFYGGLGLEAEIAKNVLFGIESRFNYAKIDDLDNNSVSVLARLGYKF